MADLKTFAEQLVNLSVKEVSELADILKNEYGIEPAAAAVAAPAAAETPSGSVARASCGSWSSRNSVQERCKTTRDVALDVTWSCNRYSNLALDAAGARSIRVPRPETLL